MKFQISVEAWEETPFVDVDDLERLALAGFPTAVADRARGDAHTRDRLAHLEWLNAPEVVMDSERSYLGRRAFLSVREERWAGAEATAYLCSISPPLGDGIDVEVSGAADGAAAAAVAGEVAAALGMVVCAEVFR